MRLVVDLASKFSAACVVDVRGEVCHQFDSLHKSAFEFAEEVAQTALDYEVTEVILEDVPYGIHGQAQVKPVLRLQGILIRELGVAAYLDDTFFLNPSTWQHIFPGVGKAPRGMKGQAASDFRYAAAREHAERLGYQPPTFEADYIESCRIAGKKPVKTHREAARKSETDYIDAFLMGIWANTFDSRESLRAAMQVPFI